MNLAENNRKKAWEAFDAGRLCLDSRPFWASIEITRNCNFRCIMCARYGSPKYRRNDPDYDMKPGLFRKIVREIFPFLEFANLQGFGETMISPYWPEILEMCVPYAGKIKFGLVTNLSLSDPEMWRKMVSADFRIAFSCDGATKRTFEHIRRGSRFENIMENLATVCAAIKETGKGRLSFLVTLQKDNYVEMPDFVKLAKRHGVRRINYNTVRNSRALARRAGAVLSESCAGRLDAAMMRSFFISGVKIIRNIPGQFARGKFGSLSICGAPQDELLRVTLETIRLAEEAGIQVIFNDAFLESLGGGSRERGYSADVRGSGLDHETGIRDSGRVCIYKKCFKPYSRVTINYRGEAGLCNHLISDEKWRNMGDLKEEAFDAIWNSEAYRNIREKLTSGMPDSEACRWCFNHRTAD